MKTTTLKRFEFSSSRTLADGRIHGNNFAGWAGVSGAIDPHTGMLINIVTLKQMINNVLDRYDHRSLNTALYPVEPTTINIARGIAQDLAEELSVAQPGINLERLDLEELDENAVSLRAPLNDPGNAQFILRGMFSAAHRTHAPHLDSQQNQALYGRCNNPAGHGHNYQVEIGLDPTLPLDLSAWKAVWEKLDHRNLSLDVPDFSGRNVVTEAVARFIADQLLGKLPVINVRVWETPDFSAEYQPAFDQYRLSRRYRFHAAHRLESPYLSAEQNQHIFGKCNRPEPHGHTYIVQLSVASRLDPLTETAADLACLDQAAQAVVQPLDYTFLDENVEFFRQHPSTGENIAAYLWDHFNHVLQPGPAGTFVDEIRVWETPNNQFIVSK